MYPSGTEFELLVMLITDELFRLLMTSTTSVAMISRSSILNCDGVGVGSRSGKDHLRVTEPTSSISDKEDKSIDHSLLKLVLLGRVRFAFGTGWYPFPASYSKAEKAVTRLPPVIVLLFLNLNLTEKSLSLVESNLIWKEFPVEPD